MSENGSDRELILGNKQLLAIFFVAALLCGVFFAVGYVVGGNSVKNGSSTVSDSTPPISSEGKREEPAGLPPTADTTAAVGSTGTIGGTGSTPAETMPANPGPEPRMADNPAAAGSAPVSTASSIPATPPPVTKTPAASPVNTPSLAATAGLAIPEKGASYLQVAAQKRPDADKLAKTLRDGGWPAILAESSKPELVEILVGPYRAPLALADAKRKLTELGFGQVIVHKYQ